MKTQLSVLDLCPILSGESAAESFIHTRELARFTESLDYKRYWMAEHHNMQGIGSSSPEVLIAYVAQATKTIRVGSGGIMLPNHPTLHVAEAFRTLHALFPGRIDLGLGRAPGSGSKATLALRGSSGRMNAENFPQELEDLMAYLNDNLPQDHPHAGVLAVPTGVPMPEIWMLGSSEFGAKLAADKGLPYAFAQHFSHLPALEVIDFYRNYFRPSAWIQKPYAMIATHIICAETDEEAEQLALSSDLSFSLFVQTGKSIPLPTVAEARAYPYSKLDWEKIRLSSMPKFIGSPQTIKKLLTPFLDAGIDELMIMTMVHDQAARRKSYELVKSILSA